VGVVRARRNALASLLVVLAAVVVVVLVASDPLASSAPSSDVADNATPTSLARVSMRALSSQTQVNATLGYAHASSIRVPAGTAPSSLRQAEQAVAGGEGMLQSARAALAGDGETLAGLQAALTAAREQESVDCAGDGAVESACASDAQRVASDTQASDAGASKLDDDRASIASGEKALASADEAAVAARSTAATYGPGATFTMLPAVGRVIVRGQSLYEIAGQPVLLLYGSLVASRAFLRGMAPGRDVAALNANLDALGFGPGLNGERFSAATEAAIRALQSSHGAAATGALGLGSVVFEPGPVRVTSVTPEVGASVAPGPVLGITSTRPQVTIALSAAQQSSVEVGDQVSITLPDEQTTPGVVSSVGTVAKAPTSREGGGGGPENGEEGGPTIEVDVRPSEPQAIGHLDEAPVAVSITTASVQRALVVPVDSLLALAGGGYAIEVVEARVHRLEAVALGLFDDAEGLVQVSGREVRAGQRVVVPES
jgi:peptidoglycan hydrolase-like protein with peptidoglycan-binding domain